jgi:hypothetical protein
VASWHGGRLHMQRSSSGCLLLTVIWRRPLLRSRSLVCSLSGFEARPPPSFGQVGCTCGSHLFSKIIKYMSIFYQRLLSQLELKMCVVCVLFYIFFFNVMGFLFFVTLKSPRGFCRSLECLRSQICCKFF